MIRILVITALFGLVAANSHKSLPHPLANFMHDPDHHRAVGPYRHHHNGGNKKIIALDQLIKNRRPSSFLGSKFIQAQLENQPKKHKYLTMTGKEERDLNGTIIVNGRDAVVELSQIKEGNFYIKDADQHVVGSVDLHGTNVRHVNIHKHHNGLSDIHGENVGSAVVTIDQDLLKDRKNPDQPRRHVQARVEQNHDSKVSVQYTKLRPEPKYHIHPLPAQNEPIQRFRRESPVAPAVEQPCSENGCLNDVVA